MVVVQGYLQEFFVGGRVELIFSGLDTPTFPDIHYKFDLNLGGGGVKPCSTILTLYLYVLHSICSVWMTL